MAKKNKPRNFDDCPDGVVIIHTITLNYDERQKMKDFIDNFDLIYKKRYLTKVQTITFTIWEVKGMADPVTLEFLDEYRKNTGRDTNPKLAGE